MINYLSRDRRSPLGAPHKLVCLVAKMSRGVGGNGSGRTVTEQCHYPACVRSSGRHLLELKVKGPMRQVPSITNLLSVTIAEMTDGVLSFTVVLKLSPHE